MCDFCKNEVNILIESSKIENVYIIDYIRHEKGQNNIVIIEKRMDKTYLRLVDRNDMQCLDRGSYIEINFCPKCGNKF